MTLVLSLVPVFTAYGLKQGQLFLTYSVMLFMQIIRTSYLISTSATCHLDKTTSSIYLCSRMIIAAIFGSLLPRTRLPESQQMFSFAGSLRLMLLITGCLTEVLTTRMNLFSCFANISSHANISHFRALRDQTVQSKCFVENKSVLQELCCLSFNSSSDSVRLFYQSFSLC